ncbi:hypothetical protein D3C71_1644060 [compost metagenome]
MIAVQLTDTADAFHGRLVFQFATQRVAGIGRIDDHPTFTQHIHRLVDQARLRVIWMDIKKLTHDLLLKMMHAGGIAHVKSTDLALLRLWPVTPHGFNPAG